MDTSAQIWEFVLYFIVTLVVAIAGGVIARKLKVPAGGMLGAMVAVAAFNIITGKGLFPTELRPIVQIFSGALIGNRVSKKDVKELKIIIFPTLILLTFMVLMNITLGFTVHKVGGLDIATSLFATSPGGLSDMSLLSEELGANPTYVSLLQLLRIITIYTFMPAIIHRLYKRVRGGAEQSSEKNNPKVQQNTQTAAELTQKEKTVRLLSTLGCGFVGGLIFYILDVTGGPMLGSMLGTAMYNIFTGKGYFPKTIRNYTQITSGAFLGMRIDMASVLGLGGLLVPTAIMIAGVLFFALMTSFIMHKITKLDYMICLMASTPGGMQEIALLSEELGVDTTKVAVMQTARLMFVVALFPTMISFLTGALG